MSLLLVLALIGMAKSFNWPCHSLCAARKLYHPFKLRERSDPGASHIPNKMNTSKGYPSVWIPKEQDRSNTGQRPRLTINFPMALSKSHQVQS